MNRKQNTSQTTEPAIAVDTVLVTVCSECLQASCWQGIFMCDNSRNAGTVKKTKEELRQLNLEHPSYWENGY